MDSRNRRQQTNIYTQEQIKRVLSGSGITIEKEADSEYIIFCPFHSNHRTPAGEINKFSGLFFCFSCSKTADLVELVMHFSGRTYFEAVRFIKSKETQSDIIIDITNKLVDKDEFTAFDESLIDKLNSQALISEKSISYFKQRKINKESVIKFKLGYSENQNMVTVPVYNHEGLCVGFVARSVEGKEFKNTPGLPKSKLLFNLNRVKAASRVYVVESSFDAIRLDQVGIAAVATLGANVSSKQIELLKKYFNDIVLIADNDEAGLKMKEKMVERLGNHISILNLDSKYKDIGDMEDSDIIGLDKGFQDQIREMLV